MTVYAIEVELQTTKHWWVFEPSTYHDSFFHDWVDHSMEIPTQVSGAIGEALTIIAMERLFQARNIEKVTPHPSSKSADFIMDINLGGNTVTSLVEAKGSNRNLSRPDTATIAYAASQLLVTRAALASAYAITKGFALQIAFSSRRIFVVEVF